MDEAQRNGILVFTPLMHVMHVQRAKPLDLDIPGELRDLVDVSLASPPIEAIFQRSSSLLTSSKGAPYDQPASSSSLGRMVRASFLWSSSRSASETETLNDCSESDMLSWCYRQAESSTRSVRGERRKREGRTGRSITQVYLFDLQGT